MKKALILAIFVTSVFVFAPVAHAVTIEDLQKQIQELVTQITELKSRLAQYEGNIPARICFVRNLRVGDAGTDVLELHQLLEREGFTTQGTTKNNFTEQSAAAVVGLQEKYMADILKPYGLVRGTGYVGPSTRAFLNKRCGQTRPTPTLDPVISGVDGPTVLRVGEVGTWTVKASDPKNGSLSYSVDWGDKVFITNGSGASVTEDASVKQTATFTHSYATVGAYTITFTVRNQSGGVAKTTITVKVGSPVAIDGKITVLSPNGGETWGKGSTQYIQWKSPIGSCPVGQNCVLGYPTKPTLADLYLSQYTPPCTDTLCPLAPVFAPLTIAKGVSSSYRWTVGTVVEKIVVPSGNYLITACASGSQLGDKNCDSSDSYFKITDQSIAY